MVNAPSHTASAIVRQEAAVAAITARTFGAPTCLVGVARIEEFQALIARRGSGPRRCRDLRDRRIGLPATHLQSGIPRVNALRGATVALESEGMYHRSVEWLDLPSAESMTRTLPTAYAAEMAALEEGLVDAVYVRGPAGQEAVRAAGAHLLFDISRHRDGWVRAHAALLQAITVNETLQREHPDVVSQVLLECWPQLPAGMNLDESSVNVLETLKTFMVRWSFVTCDFSIASWMDSQPPRRAVTRLRPIRADADLRKSA
jgi:ABC-type nitrate/sulfonate/bicarbonate transport system substrate-binding protein